MTSERCDGCGKFRKEKDIVYIDYAVGDGLEVDNVSECRWCMSEADRELYFKEDSEGSEKKAPK